MTNLAITWLGHSTFRVRTPRGKEVLLADFAFLPIGDRFTMGPDTAAIAAQWLGVKQVVPMHYGTFPLLTGTPQQLEEHLSGKGIEVLRLRPGETTE